MVLNPATPLSALDAVLGDVDMVLMTVDPGFGGQPVRLRKSMTGKNNKGTKGKSALKLRGLDLVISRSTAGSTFFEHKGEVTMAGANVIVRRHDYIRSAGCGGDNKKPQAKECVR